jgi:hypothetical protein
MEKEKLCLQKTHKNSLKFPTHTNRIHPNPQNKSHLVAIAQTNAKTTPIATPPSATAKNDPVNET